MVGGGRIAFEQDGSGLHLTLSGSAPNPYAHAFVIQA
jgi:hypothetical protein